jgi:hypothetical protein
MARLGLRPQPNVAADELGKKSGGAGVSPASLWPRTAHGKLAARFFLKLDPRVGRRLRENLPAARRF